MSLKLYSLDENEANGAQTTKFNKWEIQPPRIRRWRQIENWNSCIQGLLCVLVSSACCGRLVNVMSGRNNHQTAPWLSKARQKSTEPAGDKFLYHREILSFVKYIQQNSEQKAQRNSVVDAVRKVILQLYPTAEVRRFRSSFKR